MADDVSCNELYRIINRALRKLGSFDDVSADCEVKLFANKYNYRRQNQPQLDIFENSLPAPEIVEKAVQFCSDLESYREITNVYQDTNLEYSEEFYRRLYKGLTAFENNITEENVLRYNLLKQNLQRRLPEYREKVLLDTYNREIDIIKELKKKKNPEQAGKATYFFNQVLHNEDLKAIEPSPEKMALYERCLDIVDCLPKEKYSRSMKFAIKRDLNINISQIAGSLGPAYGKKAEDAKNEATRFQNAINKASEFAQKKPKTVITEEMRCQRAYEEFWFR